MTSKNTIVVQINFINDLLNRYNESDFGKKILADLRADKCANTSLSIANHIYLETEREPNKEIQTFFSKKFKALVSNEEKGVLLNAMRLYNDISRIIK